MTPLQDRTHVAMDQFNRAFMREFTSATPLPIWEWLSDYWYRRLRALNRELRTA